MNFRLHLEELKASGDLPSPGGVALSLINLTRKPDVSLSEIAHVVMADPSLSGKLIKSANLLKAGTRLIASVSGALNLLGLDAARQLAISFAIVAGNRRGLCSKFDYMKFWSTSLARAIIAQMLCEREKVAQPEECFVGALLSDVGLLALATLYPTAFSEILAQAVSVNQQLASERSAFETDHIELTMALLEDWMLPPLFVNAANHYKNPSADCIREDSREERLGKVWRFSNLLAEKLVSGEKSIIECMPELVRMGEEMDLDAGDLAAFSDEAVAKWKEWSGIIEVPSLNLPSFADMMAALPAEKPAKDERNEFILRILVAGEDMPGLGQLAHDIADLGHKVCVATNQQDALQLALDIEPQVILCDFAEQGPELAESLRKLPSGKFFYLIVMSREESEDMLVASFRAGADAVIDKTYGKKELGARILAGERFVRIREELLSQSETLKSTATDLAVASRRAQRASLTDPLSGLPNRRYAIERLASEWQRNPVVSCLMVDIDRFKSVNDMHGHGIGDEVISHVAQILRKASRLQDAVCRFGGEEFLAILPNTNASSAMNCAERFRTAILAFPFVKGNLRIDLTVSIGVAARRPSIRHFEELIRSADAALYAAKEEGRNLVKLAGGS